MMIEAGRTQPAHEAGGRAGAPELAVCPVCDLLHARPALGRGQRARCVRCGSVIATSRPRAPDHLIAAATATLALVAIAVWAPFLTLAEAGAVQRVSLLDTGRALSDGVFWPLGMLLVAVTVAVPVSRALMLLWSMLPVRILGRRLGGAAWALRAAETLRPWAMAEIFVIGVAVSLVKLAGLATVTPGPAFWALCALAAVVGYEAAQTCRETVWARYENAR